VSRCGRPFLAFDVIQVAFECIDVRRPEAPERGEPGIHLHERFGPEPVEPALGVDSRLAGAST
jgi:hypothetical protein